MKNGYSNIDSSFFRVNLPTGKPQIGALLVAEPFLREDHFNHAVISLIEYSEDHTAMGLVLNKPTGYDIGEAVDGINDNISIPIYCGGPVSCDRLFYIHSLGNVIPDAKKLSTDLFIGGDFDAVKEYINSGKPTEGVIRFFIGYSGWEVGQLESEIEGHVWALHADGDSFWYHTVKKMGENYRNWLTYPLNPQMN
jgi:putative transcriptional regulator